MSWTLAQCQRLALEAKLLQRYMPDFRFRDPKGAAFVEGWTRTRDGENYRLMVDLPPNYPYSKPRLYVASPKTLRTHDGSGSINAQGTSHRFHTRDNGPGGMVRICHSGSWDPSRTIVQVVLKGILWCEAYATYLRTGEDIADVLNRLSTLTAGAARRTG